MELTNFMEDSISQDFYVYTLAYPESMGGAIFYVGKGKGDRIDEHEKEARKGIQSKKCDVIRGIWAIGEEVVKTKVAYFKDEGDAYLYEWGLINMTTYAERLTNIARTLFTAASMPAMTLSSATALVPIKVLFGKNLYHIRKSQGISQEQLSKSVGLSREEVSRIERGRNGTTFEYVDKIAQSLNVLPHALFASIAQKRAKPKQDKKKSAHQMQLF